MPAPLLINTQLSLFFAQPLQKPEDLWDDLRKSSLGSLFDQTPRIQPVPNEPQYTDVPVLQMQSGRGHALSVSHMRAEFTYLHPHGPDVADDAPWLDVFARFFAFFDEQLVIRRIGFVKRFFVESVNPPVEIAELFRFDPVKTQGGAVHEAGLRFVTRDRFGSFIINNFTSVEQATATGSNGRVMQGFLVLRDVNTAPEENYLFDADTMSRFFADAEEMTRRGVENLLKKD